MTEGIDLYDDDLFARRLARRLAYRRIMAGLSQRKLEGRMGYLSSMVSLYETVTRTPRITTLLAFAKALACDVRDLIPSSLSMADDPVLPEREPAAVEEADAVPVPAVLPEFEAECNVPDTPEPSPPPRLDAVPPDPQPAGRPAAMPWDDSWQPPAKDKAQTKKPESEDW